MSDFHCPCCGKPINGAAPIDSLVTARLSPEQLRIIDALASAYPRGITRRVLADIVFADDPNGGPDSAENQMSVQMHWMRPTLRQLGWTVGVRKGSRLVYLTPLEAKGAKAA